MIFGRRALRAGLATLALALGALVQADELWRPGELLFPDAWAGPTVNPAELARLEAPELWLQTWVRTQEGSTPYTTWGHLRAIYRAPGFSVGGGTGLDYYRAEVYGAYAWPPFGMALWARKAHLDIPVALAAGPPSSGVELGLGAGWAGEGGHRAWLWWLHGPEPGRHRMRVGYRLPLGPAFGLIEIEDDFKAGRFRLDLAYGYEVRRPSLQQRYRFDLHPEMDANGFGFDLTGAFEVRAPLWRPELRAVVGGGARTRVWIRHRGNDTHPAGLRLFFAAARWTHAFETRVGDARLRFELPYLHLGLGANDVRLDWGLRLQARMGLP